MYFLHKSDNPKSSNNEYHETTVPSIFVALWIAGLSLSIITPRLPLLDVNNPCSDLLSSLICIYFVFIIEVFVTFTDICNFYELSNVKPYLWKLSIRKIIPNVILTIVALVWYYFHQSEFWLIPFVILSSLVKWHEVWLANNGDKLFAKLKNEDSPLVPKIVS